MKKIVYDIFVRWTGKMGKGGIRVPGRSINFRRIDRFLKSHQNWFKGGAEYKREEDGQDGGKAMKRNIMPHTCGTKAQEGIG